MIRDDELNRLVKYAQGLGVKVVFSTAQSKAAADWTLDGSEITVYKKSNTNKTDLLLNMIHELGHQAWFIHERNRKPDLKFEEAIGRQDEFDLGKKNNPAPKNLREKILNVERASTEYWYGIYKETNMKFPLYKLYIQMEIDVWQYEVLHETGQFPTLREVRAKLKEITPKYKAKSYE